MASARSEIYDPDSEGVYHCFSRCVRRAWLCGKDKQSGRNHEHRKAWLQELLELAATYFVIDMLSFSILSNHFHVILRNRPDRRDELSPEEIARRWLMVYPKRRDDAGNAREPTTKEIEKITSDVARVETLRKRLGNISWLMAVVKQRMSRRSNIEEKTDGAFWEKRFEMRKLESENAVLACSVYVDLNPIRAGLARTPEDSAHSSVQLRAAAMRARAAGKTDGLALADRWLAPIHDRELPSDLRRAEQGDRASDDPAFALPLPQYLEMVDRSGRLAKEGKAGVIPSEFAPILERMRINPRGWHELVSDFGRLFRRIAGDAHLVEQLARERGRLWFHGVRNCRRLFGAAE